MKKNNRSFTSEEFKKLIENELKPEYAACLTLIFLTGMRVSECLALKGTDILIEKDFVIITALTLKRKGRPVKNVPICMKFKDDKLLFDTYVLPYIINFNLTPKEKLFDMSRFMVRKHAVKLGFKTVHNLRRSFINNMADRGLSLFDLVTMLNLHDTRAIKEYWNKYKLPDMKRRLERIGGMQ